MFVSQFSGRIRSVRFAEAISPFRANNQRFVWSFCYHDICKFVNIAYIFDTNIIRERIGATSLLLLWFIGQTFVYRSLWSWSV